MISKINWRMKKKILIISKCPTHPTNAGNRWGILAQAKILKALGADVYFLYVEERAMSKHRVEEFNVILKETREYWEDKFYHFRVPIWEKTIFNVKKRWFAFRNKRLKCDMNFPLGLISFINRLDDRYHFDACIVNYYYMTKLLEYINIPKKAVFTHDNFAYKDIRLKCRPGKCGDTTDANEMAKAMQRSPHIFAVQDEDAIFFQQLSPLSHVYTIYSKYDYHSQPIINNHNILFLSGNNSYNQNGIRWFIKEVFPLIRKQYEDAQLLIGGTICKTIQGLGNVEGVHLFGLVDDLFDFYKLGDVAINPVFQGTGLKIKTFEAISYDKVTIVHTHSMSGIFHKDKAPLFASVYPEEWVKYIDFIWNHPEKISEIKTQNAIYLTEMNEFIVSEYKRFLNS